MCLARLLTAVTRPEPIAIANPVRLDRQLNAMGGETRVLDFADKAGTVVGGRSEVSKKGARTRKARTQEAVALALLADEEQTMTSLGVEPQPSLPRKSQKISQYRGMPL